MTYVTYGILIYGIVGVVVIRSLGEWKLDGAFLVFVVLWPIILAGKIISMAANRGWK